jgi:LytS/YehU family sensor histidine kinase
MGFTLAVSAFQDPQEDIQESVQKLVLFAIEMLLMIYASFYAFNTLQPKGRYLLLNGILLLIVLFFSYIDGLLDNRVTVLGTLQGFWANIVVFPFFLFVAFGFKLAYHGARQTFVINKLQAEQTESELKLLKSQVNPHFLFNTLNNIYSTNMEDHDKANEIILELADLLRYQLESNKKKRTSLKEEISSLENYIALEKIRVRDCNINVVKKGNFDNMEILPLLLLPFVENAFKYGTGIETGEIDIVFDMKESGSFMFSCKNKIVQKKGKVHSGGIGLENVKKRLALSYPNRYELDINEEGQYFFVLLKLKSIS